ncbi:RNA 2',3'-cyclic phosphodiesterase [Bacillus benzoevorans]|uniref:RNA 2',3'-cyclic phosphodiesterase n=1 Tax=Bacillus benzoevorans TaxID=1456 RepID=A0A7X0HRV8_9BACI|nr:RNA 2',3'-cyclic phosphodiesterase [Bacillus benzoevorans]MBB6445755.1 2'-5' RNA ligase [Bacillus benzoevorans]
METKSHYFWAARLPDEAKHAIHARLGPKQSDFQFKRWVHEDDYHITLAFLGYAEPQQLDVSAEIIGQAIRDETSFPLAINHIGVFGRGDNPRIFWGGMAREERLFQLQTLVFKACLQAGFKLDKRPFTPHITLARNWSGESFERQWLAEHNPFKDEIPFSVNEVVLYRTKMGSAPKYETVTNLLLNR